MILRIKIKILSLVALLLLCSCDAKIGSNEVHSRNDLNHPSAIASVNELCIEYTTEDIDIAFEMISVPSFKHGNEVIEGDEISLEGLSNSGRYVLCTAKRNLNLVWDTKTNNLQLLQSGNKTPMPFALAMLNNGSSLAICDDGSAVILSTSVAPKLLFEIPEEFDFPDDTSNCSINLAVKGNKAFVWILDFKGGIGKTTQFIIDLNTLSKSIPQVSKGAIKREFELFGFNADGCVVGTLVNCAIVKSSNKEEPSIFCESDFSIKDDSFDFFNAAFNDINQDGLAVGRALYVNNTVGSVSVKTNGIYWTKSNGLMIMRNSDEAIANTNLFAVNNAGLIVGTIELKNGPEMLAIWSHKAIDEPPIPLQKLLKNAPKGIHFKTLVDVADDNSIISKSVSLSDFSKSKYVLLKPCKK